MSKLINQRMNKCTILNDRVILVFSDSVLTDGLRQLYLTQGDTIVDLPCKQDDAIVNIEGYDSLYQTKRWMKWD